MDIGSGPPPSNEKVGPFFDDTDPKEAAAGATCSGLVGAVLCGISTTVGTAAVTISLPGILAGFAVGASLYGAGVGFKWLYHKVTD